MRQVRKVYTSQAANTLTALQGLDLDVPEGVVFGFIGPNGAGKTTTIKILTGLGFPTSGSARIFGEEAGTVEACRLLGYLPEIASYHDFMSVEELLRVHARLAGVPRARETQACTDALEAVRLLDRRASRLRELSKGMQQRFGIAQAIVGRPRLLVLDEPTSGLDPLRQKEVKEVIADLKKSGITIFFSSHKLTEVENVCDVVGILHQGSLKRCCGLDDLLVTQDRVRIVLQVSPSERAALVAAGLEVEGEAPQVAVSATAAEVTPIVGTALGCGAQLVSVTPHRISLEQAFFDLVGDKTTP